MLPIISDELESFRNSRVSNSFLEMRNRKLTLVS